MDMMENLTKTCLFSIHRYVCEFMGRFAYKRRTEYNDLHVIKLVQCANFMLRVFLEGIPMHIILALYASCQENVLHGYVNYAVVDSIPYPVCSAICCYF